MKNLRIIVFLVLFSPIVLSAETDEFRPLANSLADAISYRDFVKFVKCFPEKLELLEHLKKTRDASITLAMVNEKFPDQHKVFFELYKNVLKTMDEEKIDAGSLTIKLITTRGARPKINEMNLLEIKLEDKNGKTFVIKAHDLIYLNNKWIVGDKISTKVQ